ncbi:MAG: macrolide ABC transporter ATP-binding protein [Candidatus Muproteobacteria bacterium RBG_16_65_34]|uniref:Macrolide ABC transporter ATP-binding protein n=1 Tax=Candidatus Muproteobacteria bacterium RBG_16_65_34 TaxID=1817760 RepID=A0A1F6TSH6_9PROT|nr:MAG: macrolide ABC transporter ATP-binding protein [Candidatus Muproteobacteria bacterium RBG_16_65_34]
MEHTVICRNVSKIYRQDAVSVQALTDINLEIPRLDFVCLSGPSGSGKSTLLNLIGGLDKPTSGEITVDGARVDLLDKGALAKLRLHRLGFVFQSYNLIPVLTARENVEFVMQLQGVRAVERSEKARDILKEVGLDGLEDRRPGELSGGQQQRVAVARAIVSQPSLVLADEPTANLDSKTAENLMQLLRHMNREHGVTFIFSTHDRLVMDFSRRLITLHDGRIVDDRKRE